MNLLIKQVHVIDPKNNVDDVLDVLIKNGRIAEIKKQIEGSQTSTYDGKGKHLFPGLIDIHVHFREPGFEQKETIETGSYAAIKGGFVAVVTMGNTEPPCDHHGVIDNILRRANEIPFYIFPCATITKGRAGKELSEMADLKRAGAWAVSDDGSWVGDSLLMRRALEYASMLNLIVISHCEDKRLTSDGIMNEGLVSTTLGLHGIPNASEEVAVARDLILAKLTRARLHVTHISTKGSLDMIRRAKEEGALVTCDVTPHHFSLTDDSLAHYDTNFKMMPPLRTGFDRDAMVAGLQDGTIDCIVTDHAPHTSEEKMREFPDAPPGVIGLETSLGISLTELYQRKILSLKQLVEKMSTRPAQVLGLPAGFGEVKVGTEANLTLVNLKEEWVVRKDRFVSKSKNSCFIGKKLTGRAVATLCRGKFWQFNSETNDADMKLVEQ